MLKNKKTKIALVIGAGKSGAAAAGLLYKKGFKVFLSDKKTRKELRTNLKELKGPVFINEKEALSLVEKTDFAVKSPGILKENLLLKKLDILGKPVYSEIETAMAFCPSRKLVAITGTNGKTTTTELVYSILSRQAKKEKAAAIVCGNIGKPACEQTVKSKKDDYIVMEVSSYQLEDSVDFRPMVSAILNITPDHLDHHGGMVKYAEAKTRIFLGQKPEDFCVLNYEDPLLKKMASKCPCKILFFSSKKTVSSLSAWLKKGKIIINFGGKKSVFTAPDVPGVHNLENAMAAALCALAAGASRESITEAFASFKGVEHRIETVKEIKGVKYINDSKATNVDSTVIAIRALGRAKNIWLILGGLDKGAPYKPLSPLLKKYAKKILTVGTAAAKIENELGDSAVFIRAGSVKKAVEIINKNAVPGDIALLSPACASYDQFSNFEERGERFKSLVNSL